MPARRRGPFHDRYRVTLRFVAFGNAAYDVAMLLVDRNHIRSGNAKRFRNLIEPPAASFISPRAEITARYAMVHQGCNDIGFDGGQPSLPPPCVRSLYIARSPPECFVRTQACTEMQSLPDRKEFVCRPVRDDGLVFGAKEDDLQELLAITVPERFFRFGKHFQDERIFQFIADQRFPLLRVYAP